MIEKSLTVHLGERSYDIHFSAGGLADIGQFVAARTKPEAAFIVTDKNVVAIAEIVDQGFRSAGFRTATTVRAPGEAQKSLPVAEQLYDQLLQFGADRRTIVVAVGGGVIGDLAGFVAATYARGIPLLMVPTTLLAMVDSAVGGKMGVNHQAVKNIIGAFHQPMGVFIDIETLNTLPQREYRSGLAEVVKYGVSLDAGFFEFLEQNVAAIEKRETSVVQQIIARCCELKASIVEQDERELTGVRAKLNYGHTFAHAFEAVGAEARWLHGEAVAAGMMCASQLASRRGLAPAELNERQHRLLSAFDLPTAPLAWSTDALIAAMRRDKKSQRGAMRLVLPTRLGEVSLFDNIPESDVRDVLCASIE